VNNATTPDFVVSIWINYFEFLANFSSSPR